MTVPPFRVKRQSYVSWSALFSGAVSGVGLNFLLNLLALALGIASFSVNVQGKTVFSAGGFFCFCLSAFISMFTTGWIAGRLTPRVVIDRRWGIAYGFFAWCLLLMMTIILITNMIQYASFHSNFTANLVEIKLTADAPLLTTTLAHETSNSPLSFNIETHKKIIVVNAILTALLFSLGALCSCLGGYIGYKSPPLRIHEE